MRSCDRNHLRECCFGWFTYYPKVCDIASDVLELPANRAWETLRVYSRLQHPTLYSNPLKSPQQTTIVDRIFQLLGHQSSMAIQILQFIHSWCMKNSEGSWQSLAKLQGSAKAPWLSPSITSRASGSTTSSTCDKHIDTCTMLEP